MGEENRKARGRKSERTEQEGKGEEESEKHKQTKRCIQAASQPTGAARTEIGKCVNVFRLSDL